MPVGDAPNPKSREEVIESLGLYPAQAFDFVERGLCFTVDRMHGANSEGQERHVTGQDLCNGLRDYAILQWGMLAGTVLRRWHITSTFDFGKMVYAMIDGGLMHKRESDSLDDFREVYEFSAVFDEAYKIGCGL